MTDHLDVRACHVFQFPDNALWLPINGHLCQTCILQIARDNHGNAEQRLMHADRVVCLTWNATHTACILPNSVKIDSFQILTWHIYKGEIGHLRRVHCQLNGLRRHSTPLSLQISVGFVLNLIPDRLCMKHTIINLSFGLEISVDMKETDGSIK